VWLEARREMPELTVEPGWVPPVGWPQWIDRDERAVKDGRDPLALETITTDRIVPRLVPGILALSTRARYLSFHLFLIDEYARRKLPPDPTVQSDFIRRREWEYGAAVLLCSNPRCTLDPAPIGSSTLRPVLRSGDDMLPRNYSVESNLGGYGLYYRSPLRDLQLTAPRGTPMGDRPIPIDIVAGQRGRAIATALRARLEGSEYYASHFMGDDPVPLNVLRDLNRRACLCRLIESPEERRLIQSAVLEGHEGLDPTGVTARRRAFAMALRMLNSHPEVATREPAFREATWAALAQLRGWDDPWADAVGRWAALHGKEYMQSALCLLWIATNRLGRQHMPAGGFWPQDFDRLVRDAMLPGSTDRLGPSTINPAGTTPTEDFLREAADLTAGMTLEAVMTWSRAAEPVIGGLVLLSALRARLSLADGAPTSSGWRDVGLENGFFQPGLLMFFRELDRHLQGAPALADTLSWIVRRSLLLPHDRIATGKLPDFTFRFRQESGRLRFYSRPGLDFPMADSRHGALFSIGHDLGLWERIEGGGRLTARGRSLVAEVFP
jgi:hypothetical protein